MIIKVCGMREAENIRAVEKLGVDIIGMIFYPRSKRYVKMVSSNNGLTPNYAHDNIEKRTMRAGVFVNDMPQNIIMATYNYELDYIQLHGDESPVMIENLRKTIIPDIRKDIKISKALSIREKNDIKRWQEYKGCVDMFLFDTRCEGYGGSGCKFDWSVLDEYDGNIPFLLSGGIGFDDAESIKEIQHPMFAGIDLNSKFEIEPAMKNIEKLKEFIERVRTV